MLVAKNLKFNVEFSPKEIVFNIFRHSLCQSFATIAKVFTDNQISKIHHFKIKFRSNESIKLVY